MTEVLIVVVTLFSTALALYIAARHIGAASEEKQRRATLLAAARPLAEARVGGPVVVSGSVRPGPSGELHAPLGGAAVWFRLVGHQDGGGETFDEVFSVTDGAEFEVEDASGAVRVKVTDPEQISRYAATVTDSGAVVGLSSELATFLAARQLPVPLDAAGFTRRMSFRQYALQSGTRVLALGTKVAEKPVQTPNASAYRSADDPAGAHVQLLDLMTNRSEQDVRDEARPELPWSFLVIAGLNALGGIALLVAILATGMTLDPEDAYSLAAAVPIMSAIAAFFAWMHD